MCYLFGSLQHFTKTLLTIVTTILYRRIMGQVDAGQVHSLPQPPRVMQTLHFQGTLPDAPIYAARCIHEPIDGLGTNNYYISGYFGSCNYYFQFSDYHINTNQFNDTLGHLTLQIAELLGDNGPPLEAVKDWTMIQHEDALIGEGGVMSCVGWRAQASHAT